jgi:hypothetical protein
MICIFTYQYECKTDICNVEQSVVDFRRRLINAVACSTSNDYHKMIAQIDKYREKLFADPIIVDTPDGKVKNHKKLKFGRIFIIICGLPVN